jgi:hypothetical protein
MDAPKCQWCEEGYASDDGYCSEICRFRGGKVFSQTLTLVGEDVLHLAETETDIPRRIFTYEDMAWIRERIQNRVRLNWQDAVREALEARFKKVTEVTTRWERASDVS